MTRFFLPLTALLSLGACAMAPDPAPLPPDGEGFVGMLDPDDVERIVVEAAEERYGETLVGEARRASEYVIAWRAHGGIPVPPPPGEPFPPPPEPSMALLMKRDGYWLVAANRAWRRARPAQVAQMLEIAAGADFRGEPMHVPPCPDYGSVRVVARLSGQPAIVRDHGCPSRTDRFVGAAIEA